jgi:uncharacterized protein
MLLRTRPFALILAITSLWTTQVSGQVARPAHSEPIQLVVAGLTLHGTLELPAGNGPFDVALIIAGSGPTDRNGNSMLLKGPNNSLKLLAGALADASIASVRYDKRGIGQTGMAGVTESDLRFTSYSDDAAAWIAHLRRDTRFRKVIVIGHSEGALLGTIAAREASADALVLLAGAGRPIGEVLREQLKANAPALAERAEPLLRELEQGRTIADVPGDLQFLFRPSIQPYMMSWLPLDPQRELARLEIPRLVIRGTTDVQADRADAERLGQASPAVQVVMIEGMNHVLKLAGGSAQEQLATSYVDPTLPVAPDVVRAIVTFVREAVR